MAPRRSNRAVLVLLLFATLVLAACGGSPSDAASSGESSAAVPTAQGLDGEFVTLAGDSIDLGSLEGQDVVLWFWAPW